MGWIHISMFLSMRRDLRSERVEGLFHRETDRVISLVLDALTD